MITEREKRALCIAKSAYQHFTKDALVIAREIIAPEREMAEDRIFRFIITHGFKIPEISIALPLIHHIALNG